MQKQQWYSDKAAEALYQIYKKTRDVCIADGHCLGCGLVKGEWEEEASRRRVYCREHCQKLYHDFYLPLGGKRLPEEDREKGSKAIDFPQFLKLLKKVDVSMATTIITFAYPDYKEDQSQLWAILDLRKLSKQLKGLIDIYILKPIDKLDYEIMENLTQKELVLFPNLTELTVFSHHRQIYSIAPLTRLEYLDIAETDIIGASSIANLVRLKILILDNAPYIGNSLSFLTKLEVLEIMEKNTTITDEMLNRLSKTVLQLRILEHPLLHNNGLLTLTNLTSLDIAGCQNINDDGLLPLVNLNYLCCIGCEQIESWGLINMRKLVEVIANNCPRFNGRGLPYHAPMATISIKNCPEYYDKPFFYTNTLKRLLFEGTNLSDRALTNVTNLEHISIVDTMLVTDASLSRLTNLTSLSIRGDTPNITRHSLEKLKNLTSLALLQSNFNNEPETFPKLEFPRLISLMLVASSTLRNEEVQSYSRLENLSLQSNNYNTGDIFLYLTNLTFLDLSFNSIIKSESLTHLTKLTHILLSANEVIDGNVLSVLTNLESIILYNGTFSDNYIDINLVREQERDNEDDDDDDDDDIREEFVIDDYGTDDDDDVNIF